MPRARRQDVEAATATPGEIAVIDTTSPPVNLPWEGWTDERVEKIPLHEVAAVESETGVQFRVGGQLTEAMPTPEFMREIGWRTQFPRDFVLKLPVDLQVQVMNSRIQAADNDQVNVVYERDRLSHLSSGNRDLMPYRRTAEIAYDALLRYAPDITPTASRNGRMEVILQTSQQEPVTPAVGDILRQGIRVRQSYGQTIHVDAYIERLVCLNGMTANEAAFNWRASQHASLADQETWLRQAIVNAIQYYNNVVANARVMAQTQVQGNPRDVLLQRARALRVPRGINAGLLDAFDEEPGDTEWHLLNALTRVASHGERVSPYHRDRLFATAGAFTGEFNMVEAVLPGGIAERVGARIVQQINEAEAEETMA